MALVTTLTAEKPLDKWFWLKWVLVLIIVFLIHLSTMGIAPFLHKDEFLIVDLGRIILHPDTDWSIAWMGNLDQPSFFLCYLGPVLQELSFQIAGEYGPRLSASIGALAAATIVVKWLLCKGTTQTTSFILGLVFLLDPIFVQAYGLARVDSWMMAFCIASCWALSEITSKLPDIHFVKWKLMLAGALFTIGFFIWPTAVFFLPLILLELTCLVKKYPTANRSWKRIVPCFLLFAVGSIFTGILLLVPILSIFFSPLYNLEGMETNVGVGLTKSGTQLLSYGVSQLVEIFRFLKYSAVLLVIAAIYAIRQRQIGLMIVLLMVVILMTFTKVYIHRVQYLLPYLIASVAGIYSLKKIPHRLTSLHIHNVILTVLLVWSVGLSLGARFILANDNAEERKRELLYRAAQNMIGVGNHGVFSSWEFYYPGRSLGWKMYVTYDTILSVEGLTPILHHIDYVIVNSNEVTEDISLLLEKEGIRDRGIFDVYTTPREKDGKQSNIQRLRILFSIFRKPYGPYKLYARDQSPTSTVINTSQNSK